ncbi:hypothetical protein Pan189_29220 [Stratiformator vulcanicus]|uniref:Uncharacterized protein n=2 Tax=Stratiformator vulcanicus TaxID=2527980 RepID=A0A517R3R2_9PLAN|nr:hypothetical protein Pan189_29220 [Stratiformator vulcanicus]
MLLLALPVACVALGGCGESVPPEVLTVREQLLLEQEPQGAVTIEQARRQVADNPEVTLIVKVGNRNFEDWSAEDQATFYVSEGYPESDYNIGPDHDPSTCPFCRWKWKEEDSYAVIQVVDQQGEVLPHSAGTVFDLAPGKVVTVTGDGSVDAHGFLVVQLSGLFAHPG